MENELKRVIDFGLASDNKEKIINFLEKIYITSVDNPKVWEQLIFDFFSKEIIVPYIICSSLEEDDNYLIQIIKQTYLKLGVGTIIWDSNECYKDLIKIRDSIKTGKDIKDYLEFFFINNHLLRKMLSKKIDLEDSGFKEFGSMIKPICYELTHKEGIKMWETIYFICPDKGIDYPFEKWHAKISSEWRVKLNNKFHKKDNKKKRKPLDSRLRHEVFKRDKYKCLECGATNKDKILHADHIIPKSQDGVDELSNLQTLCDDCNFAKSDKKWVGGNNNE